MPIEKEHCFFYIKDECLTPLEEILFSRQEVRKGVESDMVMMTSYR